MSKYQYYPDINEPDFYEKNYNKKEFYIHRSKPPKKDSTIDDFCKKTKEEFKLQHQQEFIRNWINPNTPYNNVLLFWGTGVGKTCGSVSIAEGFKDIIRTYREQGKSHSYIFVLSTDAARSNFKRELLETGCTEYKYATDDEIKRLHRLERMRDPKSIEEYESLRKELDSRLTLPSKGGFYRFLGYLKFTNRTIGKRARDASGRTIRNPDGTVKREPRKGKIINTLDDCVLIVDEAHNLTDNTQGEAVYHMIQKAKNLRVVFMTATPMIHKPKEIITILNMLLPKHQQIRKSDVLEDKFTLKPEGLKIIKDKSRGLISYMRGVDPITFPERIEVGEILKPKDSDPFKYTKLVRCEMSKIHFDTYKQFYDGTKTHEMRRLVDMVLPNPNDSKLGIFKTSDLKEYKNVDQSWLNKNKIQTTYTKGRLVITGDIFKVDNIGKWSTKYEKVLNNILRTLTPESGPIFLYNENIQGIGLTMFEEILKVNGFGKYGDSSAHFETVRCVHCGVTKFKHKKDHDHTPALFTVLEGDMETSERIAIIRRINNIENRNGRIIKLILGSKVTREAVDFKGIREIHILNFQWNLSTIEQIIGRGIRHCSHYGIPSDHQNVKIYKYVSSIPSDSTGEYDISAEESVYLDAEKSHETIKKIERVLKENAIDCALNRHSNVFPAEVKKFANCGQPGHEACSSLCDYTTCDLKCSFTPSKELDAFKASQLDTDTYDVHFYKREVTDLKHFIKTLFKRDIIWSLEHIMNAINKSDELEFIEDRYVYMALDELVKNKEPLSNVYDESGTIVYFDKYYIFQPDEAENDVTLAERRVPSETTRKQMVNIADYISVKPEFKPGAGYDHDKFVRRITSELSEVKISRVIDKLSYQQQVNVLEMVIQEISEKKNKSSNYNYKILRHFKDVLVTSEQIHSKTYTASMYESNAHDDPNKIIVGHHLVDKPKCYINGAWQKCRIKITSATVSEYRENDFLIGFMEKNKHGEVKFKIKLPNQQKDRRKRNRGFVCKEMSNKKLLRQLAEQLGVKTKNSSITKICKNMELELRKRQIKAIEKGKKVRWFYNHWESL